MSETGKEFVKALRENRPFMVIRNVTNLTTPAITQAAKPGDTLQFLGNRFIPGETIEFASPTLPLLRETPPHHQAVIANQDGIFETSPDNLGFRVGDAVSGNHIIIAEGVTSQLRAVATVSLDLSLVTDTKKIGLCRVLVEGRDDSLVLAEFFNREGLINRKDFIAYHEEGFDAVLRMVRTIRNLEISVPMVVVVDSDNNKLEKEKKLKKEKATEKEIFVWPRKELENYLVDPSALAIVLGAPKDDIEKFIGSAKVNGKALLDVVFKEYTLAAPDAQTKQIIARHLSAVPDDVLKLVEKVKQSISK